MMLGQDYRDDCIVYLMYKLCLGHFKAFWVYHMHDKKDGKTRNAR